MAGSTTNNRGKTVDPKTHPRHLVLVHGDQLDRRSSVLDGFDAHLDALWMAESAEEAVSLRSHKLRIAFYFSAMRHFRDEQTESGRFVHYSEMTHRSSDDRGNSLGEILERDIHRLHPEKLIVCHPGDYHFLTMLRDTAGRLGIALEVREDHHFFVSLKQFEAYADEHEGLLLESFYRTLRRDHNLLLTDDGKPMGGKWNYDKRNRESFGTEGPGRIKRPRRFSTDRVTDAVISMVEKRFKDHPGTLDQFDLPVTHHQAAAYLRDFIDHRLAGFGTWEDAMWSCNEFLYHSRLSAALNTRLLSPRACIDRAIQAYEKGEAPINSVEGFVRQVLGWREFVRGIYWHHMPGYAGLNELQCGDRGVPGFFRDGQTDMYCVSCCMKSIIEHGWTHHIPRLMVMGQFALLLGVHPNKFHKWHMAMYVDALDWVSLPNALGMSQYGDGGIVGTKPYCASGNYINRMSDFCRNCRYDYRKSTGPDACPFTVLYYDFLDRHHRRFSDNPRMTFQVKNLERKDENQLTAVRKQAQKLREAIDGGERI
jgi:deoxyribodipyrimidine photolyase-related protein